MTDPLYVLHRNDLGEPRYQPRLTSRERLHRGWGWAPKDAPLYRESITDGAPVLYRSHRRAERVARREMRRREEARRQEFHEVKEEA